MAMEFSALYETLLDWVYEQAEGNPNEGVDLAPFVEEHGLGERGDWEILQYGKAKGGLGDKYATFGEAAANLTPHGLRLVEQRRERRESPVERSKAARRALLRWLWLQDEEGVRWSTVDSFVGTPDASFEGSALTLDEIDRAAGYLKKQGLIGGQIAMGRKGPLRAEITAEGQNCVEHYDGDPGAYTRRRTGGNTYNTFLPNAQGIIVGEQQNFTQNNTAGIDPAAFIQLAGYVGQINGTLGLAEPERVELERVSQELHTEATSPNPEPGRLRRLATQIKNQLTEAAPTMAATFGIQMAEQALGTLM
ncbi:hypothetical protein [Streptomyces roseolilacinus]|uniref:hypothetical protein n=1 Tax=Streptomyces roseolilacinus TaxID=66904 RepID=UPI0037FA7700